MRRRRRYEKTEPLRLLELWSPGENYGTPIGCVATTFTLDAGHFEEQCLARFVAMETDPAESARAYLIEREEKLSQVFACVIVDQRHAKDQRSLRWHLLPVRLPGSAIQHAKISLLMWDGHLRIIIGSANLTPFGYRTNLEIATALDFRPDDGLPLAIARGAIDFLQQLSGFAPGTEAVPGPKAALSSFLSDVRRRIAHWKDGPVPAGAPYCELVPVLPGRGGRARSAFAQLSALWRGPAAVEATIVSPFFDQTESAIDRMYGELNTLLTTRGARTVDFWSTGRALADGQVEIDIPERLFRSPLKHRSTTHQLGVVEPVSKPDDARRPLHAKILAFDNHDFALYMQGSSNFTLAGMGLSSTPNVELNIAYVIPGASRNFFQNCMRALPEADDAADATKLLFTAAADASHDDDPNEVLLPAGFDEVLFRPLAEGGELLLRLDTALLPARFEIALPHGVVILTNEVWSTVHRSEPELALPIDRPVSSLTVKWLDDSTQWASATWVVNVTDTALLAPPAELRNLDLEDLLLILTSARPAHWLLAERIATKTPRDPSSRPVVDPLKKVDSSQFLMRRMRRLARALEGLRVRLEQPVASIEGLRWRLQGPFGPLALGRALQSESGLGAPFFIAEVASAVQDIRWNTGSALRSDIRDAAIAETLRQLKTLALRDQSDTPDNLRDYVVEQLAGVQL